jgi:hypothetical protein
VKIFLFVLFMCLMSALLIARDLSRVAKAERERRRAVVAARNPSSNRTFTNQDLANYHRLYAGSTPHETLRTSRPTSSPQDIAKKRAYWQKEKEKHRHELARLEARIRRTKWRLAERKARRRPGERLRDDPAESALEETLMAMEEERRKLIAEFLERGRRAGALPGWLR